MGNKNTTMHTKHNIYVGRKFILDIGTIDNFNKLNSQFVMINNDNKIHTLSHIYEDETTLTLSFKSKLTILFIKNKTLSKNVLYISGYDYHYIEGLNNTIIENLKIFIDKKLNTLELNKIYYFLQKPI
jgi:hypothetical protein